MTKRQVESTALRLFVYAVFMTSTIMLIFSVAVGSSHWLAPLVGVLVTIWPMILFYLREQERQDNRETVEMNLRAQSGESGGWDLDDNDGGDPTVPPAPRERTR